MEKDFANQVDDAADGIVEFVVRLLRTAFYAVFRWKQLEGEASKETRTHVVGPRVFLVASVLLGGLVAELDSEFWDARGAEQFIALYAFLTGLANVSLIDALVRSAPFFGLALGASFVVRWLDPEHSGLRDFIHYAMAGVCLTFFPTVFLAAFLFSYVLDGLLNYFFGSAVVGLAVFPLMIAALVRVYFVRLRGSANQILASTSGNQSGRRNTQMLHIVFLLVLVATIALLVFLVPKANPPATYPQLMLAAHYPDMTTLRPAVAI